MAHSQIARRQGWRRLAVLAAGVLVAATQMTAPVMAAPRASAPAPRAAAALVNPVSTIQLDVHAARTEPRAFGGAGVDEGDPVTAFKWMINLDNTGTTTQRSANPGSGCSSQDAGYPDSCKWASIAGLRSSAPVVAQGDETTFPSGGLDLPDGRYLVSVLADGYKLDGTPFSVPLEDPGTVDVPLQPLPLPTATIKAQVFLDVTEANGQYDPGEDGISGFTGKIADYLGQVNTDVFGNPLCTVYAYTDANGNRIQDPGEINLSGPDYEPTVVRLGGKCLSGDINMDGVVNGADTSLYNSLGLDPALARGELTIPNLGPNRYALSVVPPTGTSWVQTTTLEGNHDWDAWVMEGATGLDTEFVVAGEPFPATIFGFMPAPSNTYWNQADHQFQAGGHGTIKGVVDAMDIYIPQKGGLNLPTLGFSGAKIDHPIDKPWIALSDLNRGDTAVWLGRGNSDGTFQIDNVPDGDLHADVLGRAPGLHPRPAQRDRLEWRGRRHGHPAAGRLVDEVRRPRLQRPQPQRQARRRRAGRPELRAHAPQSRELADGPRLDRGQHQPVRVLLVRPGLPAHASGWSSRRTTTATTRQGSPTRPTTRPSPPRSSAQASTSACSRSSA